MPIYVNTIAHTHLIFITKYSYSTMTIYERSLIFETVKKLWMGGYSEAWYSITFIFARR